LLRLVCGLEAPSEGEIYIEGKIASDAKRVVLPPHHREIGMVFQELALWPHLSAFENVLLGMPRDFLDQKESLNAARDALGVCRLDGLENRKPSELSVGQQQRVALARALAPRPKLLLLDEPFTGLDVTLKVEIFSQIRQLVELFDLTMLLVTHDPWEAQALVSDALVLEDGSIREQGVLSELLSEPVSRTLRAFVDVGSCCRDGVL
jgi:ABC-type sulfate/molybdate transport systems ATPase subunit